MLRMVLVWLPMFAGIGFLAGCASVSRSGLDPSFLSVSVEVQPRQVDSVVHPFATVTFENRADHQLGISRSLGFRRSWLWLSIEDSSGNLIRLPKEVPELIIVEGPQYSCLKPGETMTWTIDLLAWSMEFGGERWKGPFSYSLPPGNYRLRAFYTDSPWSAQKANCSVIDGTAESSWVEFQIPGS